MSEQAIENLPSKRFSLPISWKLLGATAVVGAVAAWIAIIGLKRIQTLNENLTQTVDFLANNVKLASVLKQDLVTVTRAERNMMLARSEESVNRFAALIDEVLASMDGRLKELHLLVDEKDQQRLDQFTQTFAKWRQNHVHVRELISMNSEFETRAISASEARGTFNRMESAIDTLAEKYRGNLDAAKQAEDYRASTIAAERLALASNVLVAALEMKRAEKNLLLAPSEEEMLQYEREFAVLRQSLEQRVEQLRQAVGNDATAIMSEVTSAAGEYVKANSRIREIAGEKTNFLLYQFVYDMGAPLVNQCEALLDGLIARNEQQMQNHRRASEQSYLAARNVLLGISIFGIVVSVAISFYTGQRIAQRLKVLSRFARQIQDTGDLSKAAPALGYDEVGQLAQSFDRMRQALYENTVNLQAQTMRLAELSARLETKNKEMEQFVYTVSHDLKSPVVSCKGLLGLLREDVADGDSEAIMDSVERLDRATDQLNQIIEDLLMLSRIGRKPLELTEINVGELVADLIDSLDDRLEEAGAKVEIEQDLPPVTADRTDTRRVFENLLTNALKYGFDGQSCKIAVGGSRDGPGIRYFVRDNGPGIDPNYHDRIFGLFQRLDTTKPGTGLGLASVAKIMSTHGGKVWVESVPGQGATFWLEFPEPPATVKK